VGRLRSSRVMGHDVIQSSDCGPGVLCGIAREYELLRSPPRPGPASKLRHKETVRGRRNIETGSTVPVPFEFRSSKPPNVFLAALKTREASRGLGARARAPDLPARQCRTSCFGPRPIIAQPLTDAVLWVHSVVASRGLCGSAEVSPRFEMGPRSSSMILLSLRASHAGRGLRSRLVEVGRSEISGRASLEGYAGPHRLSVGTRYHG